MSGTIVVDRIESDASYASSINIASPVIVSNTINMTGGSITGNVNFDSGTLFVDSVGNKTGIGTTTPAGILDIVGEGTSGDNNLYARWSAASSGYAPSLNLYKSRGTKSSPTVVSSGDQLGAVVFAGYDGSSYQNAAYIESRVSLTPGANDMPGQLRFYVTPDGSTSPTEQVRIDHNGNFLFNSGYGSVTTCYGVRAWVTFQGTGTVTINGAGNVSSITDNGVGNYTVNLPFSMPDTNYCCVACFQRAGTSDFVQEGFSRSVSTTNIETFSNSTGGLADFPKVHLAFIR